MTTENELLSLMDRDAKAVSAAIENELTERLKVSSESFPAPRSCPLYTPHRCVYVDKCCG